MFQCKLFECEQLEKELSMIKLSLALATSLLVAMPSMANETFSPQRNLAAFEKLFGVTEGKRRNHTKGFCISGEFIPQDPKVKTYSSSAIFTEPSTFIGRVSHKGGKANPPDNVPGHYGLAVEITTAKKERHIFSMNTEHFFPVSSVEAFIELLEAKANGKEATMAYAKNSLELQAYKAYHSKLDNSLHPYEGATYNSINTFYLIDGKGNQTPVRWSFVPSGEKGITLNPTENFFLENMQNNLSKGEVSWDMVITFAAEGDDILNPHIKWSEENKKLVAAKLRVTAAFPEGQGNCDTMNFDPLVLSKGFKASEDPMLQARSSIYALGFGRRLSEK